MVSKDTQMLSLSKPEKYIGRYFTITVVEGVDFGYVCQLDKDEIIVGRKGDNDGSELDVELEDTMTSRQHLMFSKRPLEGGNYYVSVQDLGSKNGTKVNGEKIDKETELTDGDKIELGNTILKYEIREKPWVAYQERLYQQVTRDNLTNLWNSNYVKQELEKIISTSSRKSESFSLLLTEIDSWQQLNTTYGQNVTDSILRNIAQRFTSELNNYEIVSRWNEKQFLIVLPEIEMKAASNQADNLKRGVETFDAVSLGCSQRITMSVGVTQFPICGDNSEDLIKSVTNALFQAQQTGGNRIGTAEITKPKAKAATKISRRLLFLFIVALVLYYQRDAITDYFTPVYSKEQTFFGNVEMREIEVASKIGGRITEVLIEEGDNVKKGQLLVRFDMADLIAKREQTKARIRLAEADLTRLKNGNRIEDIQEAQAVMNAQQASMDLVNNGPLPQEKTQAKADLDAAITDLENSEITFNRISKLYTDGAESKQAKDDAEARVKIAQAKVQSARAKLELLDIGSREEEKREAKHKFNESLAALSKMKNGSRYEDIAAAQARLEEAKAELEFLNTQIQEGDIVAPNDARVEVLDVRPGDVLTPNKSICRLLEANQVWARILIPEANLGLVNVGQKAKIKVDSFPDMAYFGYIEQISGEAEFFRRNVQVRSDRDYQVFTAKVHIEGKDLAIKSGMSVEVKLDKNNR